ncbi:MAG: hypothetical protein U5K43_11060 [Halofilum sp. (in: g-proteobacteria)]|nr:hypothetical protein [Halofilum sp. (in: g-proteobacteria)]
MTACTTTRLDYDMPLVKTTHQPGGDSLERVADTRLPTYIDEHMRIEARAGSGRFHLAFVNRGDRTARLQWTEASYVGPDRRAGGVTRAGTDDGPTVIPAGSRVETVVVPRAQVRGGEIVDFFGPGRADGLEGTSVRLILPLLIGEQRHEYTLEFTVRRAEVITERDYPSGHDTFLISDPEKDDGADAN